LIEFLESISRVLPVSSIYFVDLAWGCPPGGCNPISGWSGVDGGYSSWMHWHV